MEKNVGVGEKIQWKIQSNLMKPKIDAALSPFTPTLLDYEEAETSRKLFAQIYKTMKATSRSFQTERELRQALTNELASHSKSASVTVRLQGNGEKGTYIISVAAFAERGVDLLRVDGNCISGTLESEKYSYLLDLTVNEDGSETFELEIKSEPQTV
jgi:hypothetical protein